MANNTEKPHLMLVPPVAEQPPGPVEPDTITELPANIAVQPTGRLRVVREIIDTIPFDRDEPS